jgi:hypothetical protein
MNNIEEVMAPISRVGHICLTIEKPHLTKLGHNTIEKATQPIA